MPERRCVVTRVLRDRRGIDPLVRRFRGRFLGFEFALAYLQVKPGALQQFALVGIPFDDGTEGGGGRGEIATLQRLEAALVHGDRLVIGRFARRRLRRRRGWRRRRWLRHLGRHLCARLRHGSFRRGLAPRRTRGGRLFGLLGTTTLCL